VQHAWEDASSSFFPCAYRRGGLCCTGGRRNWVAVGVTHCVATTVGVAGAGVGVDPGVGVDDSGVGVGAAWVGGGVGVGGTDVG
jgi:hypothetical protein